MQTTHNIKWYRRITILLAFTTILSTGLLLLSASSPFKPAQSPTIITQETANQYVSNYLATATATNAVVTAFIVESSALTAMNNIARQYPGTGSYRIYFGKDNAGAQVSVVVGITALGTDMTLPVYSSPRTNGNLCPPMCDAAGAIDPSN